MNELLTEILKETIGKIKTHQIAQHPKPTNYYVLDLQRACKACSEQAWGEALKVFNDGNLFEDKPIVYLKAIILNKQEELIKQKKRELKSLGGLPSVELGTGVIDE